MYVSIDPPTCTWIPPHTVLPCKLSKLSGSGSHRKGSTVRALELFVHAAPLLKLMLPLHSVNDFDLCGR